MRAIECDVRDPAMDQHLAGCDAVIHLAAIVARHASRAEVMSVNVDGSRNVFYDPAGPYNGMSPVFQSYLAGQLAFLMEFAPMFWPTINSYKRLVDGFWAPVKPTWGIDNRTASFRVIPGSPKSTRLETRCPGADVNPYLAMAAVIAAGLAGIEKKMKGHALNDYGDAVHKHFKHRDFNKAEKLGEKDPAELAKARKIVADALEKADAEKSADGKTFGELIRAGQSPGKN